MSDTQLVIWGSPNGLDLPQSIEIDAIVPFVKGLRKSEVSKIVTAINSDLYDMATEYVWRRTINRLKLSINSFGLDFVMEMIGRPNTKNISIDALSEIEIINLAADLGFINKLAQKELLHYSELINYFSEPDVSEISDSIDEHIEIEPIKAKGIIRDCVKYVLGYDVQPMTMEFISIRERLYTEVVTSEPEFKEKIKESPYFMKRTLLRTLLNLIKTKEGGELDNALSNFENTILNIWDDLTSEDKFTIGSAYRDVVSEGKKRLSGYLKSVLSKVKGFDYVPETLRSETFIEAAHELKTVHYDFNNFYNEPAAAEKLERLGTIPRNAVGICMSVILLCKLGNRYGISDNAQPILDKMLDKMDTLKWEYFLNNVFPTDRDLLVKFYLTERNKPLNKWVNIINKYNLDKINFSNYKVKKFIEACLDNDKKVIVSLIDEFIEGKMK